MLKIHTKQNINYQLTKGKVQALSTLLIQKILLNFQMIRMIFIEIFKNKTQIKNEKC